MKRTLAVILLLVFAWLPAYGEAIESERSGSRATKAGVAASKNADNPSVNFAQPGLQVETPTYLLAPATKRKAKAVTKTRKKAVRRKALRTKKTRTRKTRKRKARKRSAKPSASRKKAAEAENWWQETGNPAVFVFRDCLNYHAVRLRELAGPVPAHVQIAKAMDVTCRTEFDHMARTIAGEFGEEGFRKLAEELIQTTFVPAAAVTQQ